MKQKKYFLKNKLLNNKVSIGSWVTLGDTYIAEIMAKSGFDWLAIDMEHSAITLAQAQQLIQVIELCGIAALVRVGENNSVVIKRVMDAGACGVIVPMVNSKEDAVKAVDAVKYPPLGTRGVGLGRAQGYGLSFEQYKSWLSKSSLVIVQIEHIDAVRNLRDVLSVKEVDAFIVGPYDLSASLGRPGDFTHKEMKAALKDIIKISKELNKPAGFHVIQPDAGAVSEKIKEGYKFIGFSMDTLFLGRSIEREMAKIKDE